MRSAFLSAPVGRALAGARHLIWSTSASEAGTAAWGYVDRDEALEITRSWDFEASLQTPYNAVVDLRAVTGVDPRAFAIVQHDMARRLPVLARRIHRQALVRPPGMAGALVAGFYPLLSPRFRWRAFADPRDAYTWAFGRRGAIVHAAVERATGVVKKSSVGDVDRVREALRDSIDRDPTLGEIARRVGSSMRSIQRTLADAGTSYRAELRRLRVEYAQEMLAKSDLKIEAVARAVGFRSLSSFVAMFRELTGTTPAAFRSAVTRPRRDRDD
jgi:AraC-like DNA-binding protein